MGTWLSCECSGHTKHEPKKLTAMKQLEKSGSIPARAIDPLFLPSLFIYDMRSLILNFNHQFAFAQEDFFTSAWLISWEGSSWFNIFPNSLNYPSQLFFNPCPATHAFGIKPWTKSSISYPMMTQTNSNSEVHDNDPPRCVTRIGSSIFFISLI